MSFKLSDFSTMAPKQAVMVGMIEGMLANLEVFGAMSGGAMLLGSKLVTQDLMSETFLKLGADPIAERDNSTITGAFPVVDVSIGQRKSYRLTRLIKEVTQLNNAIKDFYKVHGAASPDGQRLTSRLERDLLFLKDIGSQYNDYILKDARDSLINSLATAIGSESDLVADGGTKAAPLAVNGVNPTMFNSLLAPLGDQNRQVVNWVMRSETWFKLQNDIILQKRGFRVQDEVLYNGGRDSASGRMITIVDAPGLKHTVTIGGTDKTVYQVLGLTSGAGSIDMDEIILQQNSGTAGENLKVSLAGNYDYELGIKGFNLASTVEAPFTKAKLSASANWAKQYTQATACAGTTLYHTV